MKRYHSSNFRVIPEGKCWYFGLETEKTATLGKNRYVVTDSNRGSKTIEIDDHTTQPPQGHQTSIVYLDCLSLS